MYSTPGIRAGMHLSLCSILVVLTMMVFSNSVLANSQYSGSWYNPARDGEGFHIEILDEDRAMVIWFTYPGPSDNPAAEQAWILGIGSVSQDTITITDAFKARGPVFGAGYDKDDLEYETWGDLTIQFSDDNNANVEYEGIDGSGSTEVVRLTSLANQDDTPGFPVSLSGAWYDPETDGQGWFVEVLSSGTALVYWFTYDNNGNQAWNLNVGFVDGNRIIVPDSQAGKGTVFGAGFDKDDVTLEPFTEIRLAFNDCDSGTARYTTEETRERGELPVVRLTGIAGAPCRLLVVQASAGGYIESGDGTRDCHEGKTCLISLTAAGQPETALRAIPRSGHHFVGWSQSGGELCNDSGSSCVPDVNAGETDVFLSPVFEPEGSLYYPADGSISVCGYVQPNLTTSLQCEIKLFEDYGYGKLEDFRLTSDRFYIDYEARKEELAALPESQRNELCNINWLTSVLDYSTYVPVPPTNPQEDHNPPWPGVFGPLVFGRVHYTLLGDQEAGQMIRRILLEWAEQEVDTSWDLAGFQPNGGSAHYQTGLNMIVYVLAWDAIRSADFVSNQDRDIIDNYLHDLMRFLAQSIGHEEGFTVPDDYFCDVPCFFGNDEVTNHAWSQDLGLMSYGVLTGNDGLYQRGIRRFFAILDGIIRPDGSHYTESQRGGSALVYSVGATSTLIRLAELAANQGHDLYGVEVDGLSLHKIVEFHIAALEDETLLHEYSAAVLETPGNCEDQVCVDNWDNLFFSEVNYHGFNMSEGWQEFELYRKRFPDSPLVTRFLAMFPDENHVGIAEGPFSQACEFREISTQH